MIDNLDKVHLGKLYFPDDEGTLATQRKAQELMYDFNATRPGEVERGLSLVHSMLAECGPDCWIGASSPSSRASALEMAASSEREPS